jgi:hypothetical protein
MATFLNVEDIVLEKCEKFLPHFNLFEGDWLSYGGNGQSKSNTWVNLANYVGCIYGLLLTWSVNEFTHSGEECFNDEWYKKMKPSKLFLIS